MDRRDLLAAMGGLASLSGCVAKVPGISSDSGIGPVEGAWPTYQFDGSRTGHSPSSGTPHADRDGSWTRSLHANNTPVIADGTVYVGRADNTFLALEATTGETQWQFSVDPSSDPNVSWSTATIDGGTVYAQIDETVYALEAPSGDEQWHVDLDGGGEGPGGCGQ